MSTAQICGIFDPMVFPERLLSLAKGVCGDTATAWSENDFPLAFAAAHDRGALIHSESKRYTLLIAGSVDGNADPAVLLSAIEKKGVDFVLERLEGAFAFALWDRNERSLSLVRARASGPHLFYSWQNGQLTFTSELRALNSLPDFEPEINVEARQAYFELGFVPAPWSLFRGVTKLESGARLTVEFRDDGPEMRHELYWDPLAAMTADDAPHTPTAIDAEEARAELQRKLENALQRRIHPSTPPRILLTHSPEDAFFCAALRSVEGGEIFAESVRFAGVRSEPRQLREAELARLWGLSLRTALIEVSEAPDLLQKHALASDEPDSRAESLLISIAREKFGDDSLSLKISAASDVQLLRVPAENLAHSPGEMFRRWIGPRHRSQKNAHDSEGSYLRYENARSLRSLPQSTQIALIHLANHGPVAARRVLDTQNILEWVLRLPDETRRRLASDDRTSRLVPRLPVGRWLRSSLREWAEQSFQDFDFASCGFRKSQILQGWRAHLQGTHDESRSLLNLLMYVEWHRETFSGKAKT